MRELCDEPDDTSNRDPLFGDMFEPGLYEPVPDDDDSGDDEDYHNRLHIARDDDQHLHIPQYMKLLRKHHYQGRRAKNKLENPNHTTILVALKNFDIPRMCPFEYMHLVCLGIAEALIERAGDIKKFPQFRLSDEYLGIASHRLVEAAKYHPLEFQRKPEGFDVLTSWKATQKRAFVLYYSPVVLRGIMDHDRLQHFYIFVTFARLLLSPLPHDPVAQLTAHTARAEQAKKLIHHFGELSIALYGVEIATLKFHALLHVVEDYIQFGPADLWSAFHYESFLKVLKSMVRAHNHPDIQVINVYSSLLYTGHFGREDADRGSNQHEQYYEKPSLELPDKRKQFLRGGSLHDHRCYGVNFTRGYA